MLNIKTKKRTIYFVRKHITNCKTGAKIRHEDYPNRFYTREMAQYFLKQKEEKYHQSVNAMIEDCPSDPSIEEGRWYEVVPLVVSAGIITSK